MTWVKLDDQFFGNPKIRRAGKDGRELYLAGLCYAAAQLTDGQIPADMLDILAAQAQVRPVPTARHLIELGLWHDEGEHYRINGWAEYNESAEQVRQRREKERLKKQQQRRGRDGKYESSRRDKNGDGGRDTSGDAARDRPGDTPGDSPPSRPVPSSTDEPHPPPTHVSGPPAGEEDEIWKLYADRKLTAVIDSGGTVRDHEAWKREAISRARRDLADRRAQLDRDYDLTATQTVDVLLGRTNVLKAATRR